MDSDGAVVDGMRTPPDVRKEEVLKWYKDMLTGPSQFLHGQISPSKYLPIADVDEDLQVSAGEEGIAVGSASALTPEDVIFAQYREAGVFQQRGFTLSDFMNQLFANCKDVGKGRNMPVHYGSSKLNIHTISSPLATQLPQATGAAYALKLSNMSSRRTNANEGRIVAAYFGEGAASEGDFHAALNIAATRSCPIIFLCRNNGFAISTTTLEQYRGDGIASRGVGYGIDTIRVDGNDIFAVREVTKKARQMALEDGGKPVLIEAMSYRVSHHSTSDDSFAYRARVEVEDWKRRDNPITRLRKWMERQGMWDEEQERETRSRIRKDVLKAFAEAEMLKKPRLRELFTDVYEEVTEEARGQIKELGRLIDEYPGEYDVSGFEDGREGLEMDEKKDH
ncbi:uncharacterized protein KY384_002732 [Bacidia gigantensis]|uniref:uncharacterized protein n=1 Tax=Bacidia gigantensis TaxID=2732470 RepID=UPI001D042FE1|nr:uncharacterized protein KY384_002732 [Bacidia gigantensis]KAG8532854.1 hypothetical protein KY384_002732 [Bacidia gigantensis]